MTSFLLGALGGLGRHLLAAGGGYLLNNVVSPLATKGIDWLSNKFGLGT